MREKKYSFLRNLKLGGIHTILDHTADAAFLLKADSYEELFLSGFEAWQETAIEAEENLFSENKELNLEESTVEELLVKFLSELNIFLFVLKWVSLSIEKIKIENAGDLWKLSAFVAGLPFDGNKQMIKTEIKAVTFHGMKIENVNGKLTTRLVFDI